ncbi:MAG: hypothetical protein HY934_05275 [Candidatus Firestonebacteria bacterium]|nr:hypothetical protein [Candidatus Firestonebacteria bacterium]
MYEFKINLMAVEPVKNVYESFFQENTKRVIGLSEMDENIYNKTKLEIISPAFLQKTKIINQNLVMLYSPLKNEVIRMNRNQMAEYETLFNEKEKKYIRLYTGIELKEFDNDRLDIKIDEHGTTYMIEMKLKKSLLIENELLKKLKLWIRGDYFLPVKYEWLNERDEVVVSVILEHMDINVSIENSEFVLNPPQNATVKEYEEVRTLYVQSTKIQKSENIPSSNVMFSYQEIRNIMQEEINKRAKIISEILTQASLDFIESADYAKLLKSVEIALSNKDIMYIMILSDNGEKLLFKSQTEFNGLNLNNPDNLKIKEISHPILVNDRIIGSVRVGLSLNSIDELLRSKIIYDSTQNKREIREKTVGRGLTKDKN